MTSYDISTLFTSVPMDPSINSVKQKLKHDPLLLQRTSMFIQQIVTLLQFCLRSTYFLFQGKYYEQVHGAAIGSPLAPPPIANLFLEEFEVKAFSSAPDPQSLWQRYLDNTFIMQKAKHSKQSLLYINSQDTHIQFTIEEPNQKVHYLSLKP